MAAIPVRDKWGRFACVPDPGHRELSALSLVVYELLPHHPCLYCTICDIFSLSYELASFVRTERTVLNVPYRDILRTVPLSYTVS